MNLRARPASHDDILLFHRWANDPDVRAQSFTRDAISFDDHRAWFGSRVGCPDILMLVFEDSTGVPIGQVRIEPVDGLATIGVSIDRAFRGRGLARRMVAEATEVYQRTHPGAVVRAFIRPDNEASRRTFECAGYSACGTTTIRNQLGLVYECGVPKPARLSRNEN